MRQSIAGQLARHYSYAVGKQRQNRQRDGSLSVLDPPARRTQQQARVETMEAQQCTKQPAHATLLRPRPLALDHRRPKVESCA